MVIDDPLGTTLPTLTTPPITIHTVVEPGRAPWLGSVEVTSGGDEERKTGGGRGEEREEGRGGGKNNDVLDCTRVVSNRAIL